MARSLFDVSGLHFMVSSLSHHRFHMTGITEIQQWMHRTNKVEEVFAWMAFGVRVSRMDKWSSAPRMIESSWRRVTQDEEECGGISLVFCLFAFWDLLIPLHRSPTPSPLHNRLLLAFFCVWVLVPIGAPHDNGVDSGCGGKWRIKHCSFLVFEGKLYEGLCVHGA